MVKIKVEEQLTQINNAISAIENGAQEYRIGSSSVKKANLVDLYNERRRLQQELANQDNGTTYVAVFDRR